MIFLDVDGVLADFDAALLRYGIVNDHSFVARDPATWTPDQVALDQAVRTRMADITFWRTLPVMKGAHELLAAASFVDEVRLLTATPRVSDIRDQIAEAKYQWAEQYLHVPRSFVLVCERHEKQLYAKHGGDVLVDDMLATCEEWDARGGTAIHYDPKVHDNVLLRIKRF